MWHSPSKYSKANAKLSVCSLHILHVRDHDLLRGLLHAKYMVVYALYMVVLRLKCLILFELGCNIFRLEDRAPQDFENSPCKNATFSFLLLFQERETVRLSGVSVLYAVCNICSSGLNFLFSIAIDMYGFLGRQQKQTRRTLFNWAKEIHRAH